MFNEMHMSQLGKSSSLYCYQLSTHTQREHENHGTFFKNKTSGILIFLMFCHTMYYVSTYVN